MTLEAGDFRRLRKAIKTNRAAAETIKGEEDSWPTYDSPIESFATTFQRVLPPYQHYYGTKEPSSVELGEMLKKYIEDTLASSPNASRYAVELGGPGSALFRGFTEDFFSRTAGVCLEDVRPPKEKVIDQGYRHSVVPGDIFDKKLPEKVASVLGTGKVDLIISRILGPLYDMKKDSAILDRIMRSWYKFLNTNGLMFIQFEGLTELPPAVEPSAQPRILHWAEEVKKKFPDIDVQVGQKTLRLHKKPGAPEELPPAKDLFKE